MISFQVECHFDRTIVRWRKDSSRDSSWRKDSPREDANPTIQSSPSQSPSIHPSSGDRETDWPRESSIGSGGYDDESEKEKAAAAAATAAAAASKPPMMILKRPTPPSTPSVPSRQSCDSAGPPVLALSPSSKVCVTLFRWLQTGIDSGFHSLERKTRKI